MSGQGYSIHMTVFQLNAFYYAVYSPRALNRPGTIFTLYTNYSAGQGLGALNQLQASAQQRAAAKKIPKIYGL